MLKKTMGIVMAMVAMAGCVIVNGCDVHKLNRDQAHLEICDTCRDKVIEQKVDEMKRMLKDDYEIVSEPRGFVGKTYSKHFDEYVEGILVVYTYEEDDVMYRATYCFDELSGEFIVAEFNPMNAEV